MDGQHTDMDHFAANSYGPHGRFEHS
jgi:hypothetical protein